MRRPTGRSSRTGASSQQRRYVRIVDAETQREARLAVEKEGGRNFTKVVVLEADWVRINKDEFEKVGVVANPENRDALDLLKLAGGPEVDAWLNANANGDVPRETFQVPRVNAAAWVSLAAPTSAFAHAVLPRVRHRLSFHEETDSMCLAADAATGDGRSRRRVVRARAGEVAVTLVAQRNSRGTHSFVMFCRDNSNQLRAEERTLNAVNCHAWNTLIHENLVDRTTLDAAPQYVPIPPNRASNWTYENVNRKFEALRALLAAGVTFEEQDVHRDE